MKLQTPKLSVLEIDPDYVAFSEIIIYQLPVVLRPRIVNKGWAFRSYFVLFVNMNLVYEPLQQEYMPKETGKLFVQLEPYSLLYIFSIPSEMLYYGYNSTGYEFYKKIWIQQDCMKVIYKLVLVRIWIGMKPRVSVNRVG